LISHELRKHVIKLNIFFYTLEFISHMLLLLMIPKTTHFWIMNDFHKVFKIFTKTSDKILTNTFVREIL